MRPYHLNGCDFDLDKVSYIEPISRQSGVTLLILIDGMRTLFQFSMLNVAESERELLVKQWRGT
jgi:hypothetical protein